MMINQLITNVIGWAHARNLIDGGCPKSQTLKCVSEVGELADRVNKKADIRDDIGDVLVTLIILAEMHDLTLDECLCVAYDDIKDRKGILVDEVFIKESDLAYEGAMAFLSAKNSRSDK